MRFEVYAFLIYGYKMLIASVLKGEHMKTIIHDLDESYDSLFKSKCKNIIHADGRYAPCQGCFGCWTKHPAKCYMKDALQMVCRVIGNADELVIITENCYGAYSPSVKMYWTEASEFLLPLVHIVVSRCIIHFAMEKKRNLQYMLMAT